MGKHATVQRPVVTYGSYEFGMEHVPDLVGPGDGDCRKAGDLNFNIFAVRRTDLHRAEPPA